MSHLISLCQQASTTVFSVDRELASDISAYGAKICSLAFDCLNICSCSAIYNQINQILLHILLGFFVGLWSGGVTGDVCKPWEHGPKSMGICFDHGLLCGCFENWSSAPRYSCNHVELILSVLPLPKFFSSKKGWTVLGIGSTQL